MLHEHEQISSKRHFYFCLRCRAGEMMALPEAISEWAFGLGVGRKTVNYINLMLDELVSNIARHAYAGDESGRIEVFADFDGNYVCVTLRDFGPPFDPLSVALPNLKLGLSERPVGGLGVLFVKMLASSVVYKREKDANEIRFCRRGTEHTSSVGEFDQ